MIGKTLLKIKSLRGSALVELCWYGVAFSLVLALGLVSLYYPFGADQAVFLLGANALSDGATLYLEYWDNKQPGIYYFYYLAGRLFGFDEFGIHLLELLWMLAFSLAMMVGLRGEFKCRWLSALVPVATVGVYYATAGEYELTQLEMLIGFPVFVFIWVIRSATNNPDRMGTLFFVSGLLAGFTVLFKLLVAPIFATIWLVATVHLIKTRSASPYHIALRFWTPAVLGVALPLIAVTIWFWSQGAYKELIWTAFVYPPLALESSPPAGKSRLITATAFFVSNLAPWLMFSAIALFGGLRKQTSQWIWMLLTWLVTAAVLFLIQRFSWWPYHMLVLFVPAGILAVFGIDKVVSFLTDHRPATGSHRMICSALIAIPLCCSLTAPFLARAQPLLSELIIKQTGVHRYQQLVSENYRPMWEGTRFLKSPKSLPGPVYAFGNAMVYPFSGRPVAHRIAGSAWEFYLPAQLQDIMDTLDRKRVPYVFVDRFDYKLFWLRPQLSGYLQQNYAEYQKDASGIWYVRKDKNLSSLAEQTSNHH